MGQALFNVPTFQDKRLFLMSDTQSRVSVVGPVATTALNLQLKAPDSFSRTADDAMYVDPSTGLLVFPLVNLTRFEVNGLILEPAALNQYVKQTEDFTDALWVKGGSPVVAANTQTAPDGITLSADAITGGIGESVSQIMAGLDPIATDYRLSVFMKPIDGSPPTIKLFVNFSGSTPDPAVTEDIVVAAGTDWLRYDLNALNANVAHNVAEIKFEFVTAGSIAIWGANFTESDYLASYRPRGTEVLATTGEEHLVYSIDAMGAEPSTTDDFTVIWEFIPLGEQGRQAPQIALAGGDSKTSINPPGLYERVVAFGAHPSVATDFRLAIVDSTSGSPVVFTHSGTYNWSRYSHQKWAFVVFNDGGQKCRFYANGAFLGETTISPTLTEDNFTKFVLPQAAIHRRIETLAEKLNDSEAIAATTIT